MWTSKLLIWMMRTLKKNSPHGDYTLPEIPIFFPLKNTVSYWLKKICNQYMLLVQYLQISPREILYWYSYNFNKHFWVLFVWLILSEFAGISLYIQDWYHVTNTCFFHAINTCVPKVKNYGDFRRMCNPRHNYVHFTGGKLRHGDSPHFLWGKHLQCRY